MTKRQRRIVAILLLLNAFIVVIVVMLLWQVYLAPPEVAVATPTPTRRLTLTSLPTNTPILLLTPSPTNTRVLPPDTPTPTSTPTFTPTFAPVPPTPTSPLSTATPVPSTPTNTPVFTPTPQPPPSGRIAFTVYEGGGYETYVANIDGSGLQKIWSRMHQPDFDPSGEWLAVNGELPYYLDLQIIEMNPDNTAGRHRKVSVHYEDSWPSWSPDGFRIVYVFNTGKRLVKILPDLNPPPKEGEPIKGPNGTNLHGAGYTVWVGNRIAFSGCDFWASGVACGVYTIGEGGGPAVQITTHSQDRATDGFGNQVLYMSPADGDWEIWKVSSTGGGRQRLTNNSAQDGLAAWSPDGQHIAFLTNRTGSWEIWAMNGDGSDPRRLFSLPGEPGEWTEERISWGR